MTDDRVQVEPAATVLSALDQILSIKPDDWTDGPISDVSLRLHRAQALITLLQEISGWLELSLIDSMETDSMEVQGVGFLRREERSRSTWRDDRAAEALREDLAHAVANTVAMDVGTGELDPLKRNVALATMRAAYEAIPSFSSIKVPGRVRFGLHLEDYRTIEKYYTVKLEEAE